jgi:hypothetical protein
MTTAEEYMKRAEQCLANARQHTNRTARTKLRQQAAEWITKAEKLDATAKRAEEARAVASETDNPMIRRSMNRLADEYESESG